MSNLKFHGVVTGLLNTPADFDIVKNGDGYAGYFASDLQPFTQGDDGKWRALGHAYLVIGAYRPLTNQFSLTIHVQSDKVITYTAIADFQSFEGACQLTLELRDDSGSIIGELLQIGPSHLAEIPFSRWSKASFIFSSAYQTIFEAFGDRDA